MAGMTGKSLANTYGDLLYIDNSNNGLTSLKQVLDGKGGGSSISLSADALRVRPSSNSTNTCNVQNAGGTNILKVDTTNSNVLIGTTGTYANSNVTTFGIRDASVTSGYHLPMYCTPNMVDASSLALDFAILHMGNGATPATTLTLDSTSEAQLFLHAYFVCPADITVDGFKYLLSADGSVTCNIYAYRYTMVTSGSNGGNLSAGAEVGSATSIATTDANRMMYGTISADVDCDSTKVILVMVENTGSTTDVTCKVDMRWHYR